MIINKIRKAIGKDQAIEANFYFFEHGVVIAIRHGSGRVAEKKISFAQMEEHLAKNRKDTEEKFFANAFLQLKADLIENMKEEVDNAEQKDDNSATFKN